MSETEQVPVVARPVETHDDPNRRLSRRFFWKSSGAAVASAGAAAVGTVAVLDGRSATAQDATPVAPDHGGMPGMGADERPLQFVNLHESATVDAVDSREASCPGGQANDTISYVYDVLNPGVMAEGLFTVHVGSRTPNGWVSASAGYNGSITLFTTIPALKIVGPRLARS